MNSRPSCMNELADNIHNSNALEPKINQYPEKKDSKCHFRKDPNTESRLIWEAFDAMSWNCRYCPSIVDFSIQMSPGAST